VRRTCYFGEADLRAPLLCISPLQKKQAAPSGAILTTAKLALGLDLADQIALRRARLPPSRSGLLLRQRGGNGGGFLPDAAFWGREGTALLRRAAKRIFAWHSKRAVRVYCALRLCAIFRYIFWRLAILLLALRTPIISYNCYRLIHHTTHTHTPALALVATGGTGTPATAGTDDTHTHTTHTVPHPTSRHSAAALSKIDQRPRPPGDAIWGLHIDLITSMANLEVFFFAPQIPPAPRCTPVVISTKLTSRLSLAPCCAGQPSFGHIQAAPRRALLPSPPTPSPPTPSPSTATTSRSIS
jgi:hypothetical protein